MILGEWGWRTLDHGTLWALDCVNLPSSWNSFFPWLLGHDTSGHPSYSFVCFFPLFFGSSVSPTYPLDAGASQVYFLRNGSGTSYSYAGTIPEPSGLLPRLPATSIQGCHCQCLHSDTITCLTASCTVTQLLFTSGPWVLKT